MAEDQGGQRKDFFQSPWLKLFGAFKIALDPKKLLLAGAGIVADSVPQSEYQECLNKAQTLLRAVELARSGE